MAKKLLLDDPRYPDFVARYQTDPLRFAVEVCGMIPSEDQIKLFQELEPMNAKVSVVSGTGCFAKGTMMMRSTGDSVAVEDIRVGDRLMGPDGASVRNVLELKRGREPMYRFTYHDGSSHTFNESHLLCVDNGKERFKVTVKEWLGWSAVKKAVHWCYRLVSAANQEYMTLTIAEVVALGEGDYYGFTLDADGRFLGACFTVLSNTGKTAAFARIALWHLLCFPFAVYDGKLEIGSNTYIGAPRVQQVQDGIFKELQDCKVALSGGPCSWLKDYFYIGKTRVYCYGFEEQWFIGMVALQNGQSVGIAGKHRYYQLVIIDEAAGVPDDHFNVIDGTQTQPGNRTLMASQGVRNAGRFYESHHNLAQKNGGSWAALSFSSENSPFVTTQWIKEREQETGGRDSVEYRIRVKGEFADDSSSNLLTRVELQEAFKPRKLILDDEPYGLMVLSDVGMGEYRDDSVAIVAKVIGNGDFGPDARRVEYIEVPLCTNSKNEIDFAGDLVNIFGRLSNATLYVDNGGIGATVCKLIERSGVPVQRIDWGKPCFKKAYKERFYNLRACAMVRFRDAVRQGRVLLPQNIEQKLREKILLQGSRLPYSFAEAGGLRYLMAKKEEMRADGIKSPDLIDAMSFAFLESAHYMPADSDVGGNATDRTKAALDVADDLLADIS